MRMRRTTHISLEKKLQLCLALVNYIIIWYNMQNDDTDHEIWECLGDSESNSDSPDQGNHQYATEVDPIPKPIRYILIFLLFWQALYKVSNLAIACLLWFMKYLIAFVGHAFQCEVAVNAANFIPITASTVHRLILNRFGEGFVQYVVCPSCHSIYEFSECFCQIGTTGYQKHVVM